MIFRYPIVARGGRRDPLPDTGGADHRRPVPPCGAHRLAEALPGSSAIVNLCLGPLSIRGRLRRSDDRRENLAPRERPSPQGLHSLVEALRRYPGPHRRGLRCRHAPQLPVPDRTSEPSAPPSRPDFPADRLAALVFTLRQHGRAGGASQALGRAGRTQHCGRATLRLRAARSRLRRRNCAASAHVSASRRPSSCRFHAAASSWCGPSSLSGRRSGGSRRPAAARASSSRRRCISGR